MKTIVAFFCTAFLASSIFAQGQGWYKQNSGVTYRLAGVSFPSTDTGWVCGGTPNIQRTTDGGLHWNQLSPPDPGGISFLQAVDGMTAWCTNRSSHGNMFFTNDGGQSWTQQVVNTQPNGITAISFPSRQIGFGISQSILIKTTNGGKLWTNYPIEAGYYHAIHFLDTLNGLIAEDGILLRLLFGRNAYIKQKDSSFGKMFFAGCYLATQAREFAVGGFNTSPGPAVIVRTIDGGNSWDKTIIPDQNTSGGFFGIAFTDSLHGTVVGAPGLIYRTTNGGDTWLKQESGVISYLNAVSFSDSLTGTIVGDQGVILRTTNGGYSWVRQNLPVPLDVEISPQPFAQRTSVRYSLPSPAHVSIGLYDVTGKAAQHIIENVFQESGMHSIGIDGSTLHEGTYYLRLDAGSFTGFGKLTKIAQ